MPVNDREGRLPDDDRRPGRQPGTTGGWRDHPPGTTGKAGYGYPDARRGAGIPPALLNDRSHRRFSELLVPFSVILVGVLAVVAFGLVINATMRSDDTLEPLPPAQPPALGTAPLAPTAQPAVPIPDASPTAGAIPPVVAGSGSPSRSGDVRTPPSRSTTRPVPPPRSDLTVSRSTVPERVDLAAEGSDDWVHWGQESNFSLERREDGGFSILEGTPTAPRVRHALSPQRFSWQGGSPVDRSSGTPTGIHTCGDKNGFTITAPAGRSRRTLRLYVGVLQARGRLDARLSTGGDTVSAKLESQSAELRTAVFTISYRAGSGSVKLIWVTEKSHDSQCGGVALQAATLS